MALKANNSYSLSLLLIIMVAMSFLSIKGWCIEKSNETVKVHTNLAHCHSGISVNKDTVLCEVEPAHSSGNKHCSSCHDLTPDIRLAKLFNESFVSPLSAPSCNSIFPPYSHSDLTSFAVLSPGDVSANDRSSSSQTQQNIALRTVILLI